MPPLPSNDNLENDELLFQMCQAQEMPQRRHRAAYLAPSRGHLPLHQQLAQDEGDNDNDQVIPLLVEVPTGTTPVSPPSSGELMANMFPGPPPSPPPPRRGKFVSTIIYLYHAFIDVLLVALVCLMGTFFYDVELRVVKSNRRRNRARGRSSGRVVIQQRNENRLQTSLLRTPPRTPDSTTQVWGFV